MQTDLLAPVAEASKGAHEQRWMRDSERTKATFAKFSFSGIQKMATIHLTAPERPKWLSPNSNKELA